MKKNYLFFYFFFQSNTFYNISIYYIFSIIPIIVIDMYSMWHWMHQEITVKPQESTKVESAFDKFIAHTSRCDENL